MDIKKMNEELMKSPQGKEIILNGLINNQGGIGFFALHKIERLIKESLTSGVIETSVGVELLETINTAYNFVKGNEEIKYETDFSRSLSEMISIQKDIYKKEDDALAVKSKKVKPI